MSNRKEVLVAIVNDKRDFAIIENQGWYRIPVSSVSKWLKKRWPPHWIAFYQTKVFGEEAYSISYFAEIWEIREVYRWQLFPDELLGENSNRKYYQLLLGQLKKLREPIYSIRRRRIIFISTTLEKFLNAIEINDLYDNSNLEDLLWVVFKEHRIPAERQAFITIKRQNYALDFAIYCDRGSIDVETDGDTWHANPEKAALDNLRDNALEAFGWKVLRYSTPQIREQAVEYCVRSVIETINNLGGVDEGKYLPRRIDLRSNHSYQLGLFDEDEID